MTGATRSVASIEKGIRRGGGDGQSGGRELRYQAVPPEVYPTVGFPGADDLGNMFQFTRDFNAVLCVSREPAIACAVNAGLQTFAQRLEMNTTRIPLAERARRQGGWSLMLRLRFEGAARGRKRITP